MCSSDLGETTVNGHAATSGQMLVFERSGGSIALRAESGVDRGANDGVAHDGVAQDGVAQSGVVAQALLLGGKPLGEPVVRYGPFVMNTREEIVRAFEEYEAGRLVAQR